MSLHCCSVLLNTLSQKLLAHPHIFGSMGLGRQRKKRALHLWSLGAWGDWKATTEEYQWSDSPSPSALRPIKLLKQVARVCCSPASPSLTLSKLSHSLEERPCPPAHSCLITAIFLPHICHFPPPHTDFSLVYSTPSLPFFVLVFCWVSVFWVFVCLWGVFWWFFLVNFFFFFKVSVFRHSFKLLITPTAPTLITSLFTQAWRSSTQWIITRTAVVTCKFSFTCQNLKSVRFLSILGVIQVSKWGPHTPVIVGNRYWVIQVLPQVTWHPPPSKISLCHTSASTHSTCSVSWSLGDRCLLFPWKTPL